jgi:hypothetical protein
VARLEGYDTFELIRPDGLFIDVEAIFERENNSDIVEWAFSHGMCEERTIYRAESDEGLSLHDTPEDAEYWRHGSKYWKVDPMRSYVALPALKETTGMACRLGRDTYYAIVMAWAMLKVPTLLDTDVDGVWWRDPYAPKHYSAPRGGIFQHAVERWICSPVDISRINDKKELALMPDTELIMGAALSAYCN